MALAGARMFFDPVAREQLAAEVDAQFEAFARTGLALDHVNAHKHFHLHPTICGAILQAGRRHGLSAARAPVEPHRIIAAIEPGPSGPLQVVVAVAAAVCRLRLRAAGLLVPDQVFGLAWSGAVTNLRLHDLIEALPPGLTEIYLHPALDGGFEGAAPGYRYAEEFAALIDPRVIDAVRRSAVALGGFSDFT